MSSNCFRRYKVYVIISSVKYRKHSFNCSRVVVHHVNNVCSRALLFSAAEEVRRGQSFTYPEIINDLRKEVPRASTYYLLVDVDRLCESDDGQIRKLSTFELPARNQIVSSTIQAILTSKSVEDIRKFAFLGHDWNACRSWARRAWSQRTRKHLKQLPVIRRLIRCSGAV